VHIGHGTAGPQGHEDLLAGVVHRPAGLDGLALDMGELPVAEVLDAGDTIALGGDRLLRLGLGLHGCVLGGGGRRDRRRRGGWGFRLDGRGGGFRHLLLERRLQALGLLLGKAGDLKTLGLDPCFEFHAEYLHARIVRTGRNHPGFNLRACRIVRAQGDEAHLAQPRRTNHVKGACKFLSVGCGGLILRHEHDLFHGRAQGRLPGESVVGRPDHFLRRIPDTEITPETDREPFSTLTASVCPRSGRCCGP